MTERSNMRVHSDAETTTRLKAELPHWQLKDGCIRRTFRTSGWRASLMVTNAVGHLAEAAWHHPEILLSYSAVEVRLNSHDAKGITDRDFALAAKIEAVVQWQPGREGQGLDGIPEGDPRHAYVKYDD